MTDETTTFEAPEPVTAPETTEIATGDGDGDETQAQPETGAQARPATTPEEMERKLRALEKQGEKHAAAVQRIMGDDFSDLIANPIDFTPGFILNPQLAPLPPDALHALDVILGRAGVDGYPVDESRQRCETCDGFGMLRTGSRVQNQDALPCRKCMGNGWVEKMATATNVTPMPNVTGTGFNQQGSQTFTVVRDQWGREQGQERFGLDPKVVGW